MCVKVCWSKFWGLMHSMCVCLCVCVCVHVCMRLCIGVGWNPSGNCACVTMTASARWSEFHIHHPVRHKKVPESQLRIMTGFHLMMQLFMLACRYQNFCVCVRVCVYMALRILKVFNVIQLEVLPAAYQSHQNLLVSAPSSVGKTNIVMLMVLRELWNNLEDAGIRNDLQFKVEQLLS